MGGGAWKRLGLRWEGGESPSLYHMRTVTRFYILLGLAVSQGYPRWLSAPHT